MSYSLKLANPRLKWENLLDSSPFLAVGWELHVKKFPKRELLAAADLSSAISDFNYGLQCAQQAEQLFQLLGQQQREIDARLMYCELAELAGELGDWQAQAEKALQRAEQMSYTAGSAKARLLLGTIAIHTGDSQAAIQYVLPSIALWRELERPFDLAAALNRLAVALLAIHEYAPARQAYEESRDIYQLLGYRRGVAQIKTWEASLLIWATTRRPGSYSATACAYATP